MVKKKKIVLKIWGGLGNQMFQFALYKRLIADGIKTKIVLSLDKKKRNELVNTFSTDFDYLSNLEKVVFYLDRFFFKILRRSLLYKTIHDKEISYKSDLLDSVLNKYSRIYLVGYFQNLNYFKQIQDQIFIVYSKTLDLNSEQKGLLDKIKSHQSVSIHVRRGDYLNLESRYGNICTQKYYNNAINYFEDKLDNLFFYVFSNDLDWCQRNIVTKNRIHFVDENRNSNSYYDMWFMSQCCHNIIANSTFSWWGAFLNLNENKIVICPNKFINGTEDRYLKKIYLKDWIQIES